MRWMNQ